MRILGLDILGGDRPPEVYIPALVTLLDGMREGYRLALFATQSFLEHWRSLPVKPYLQHPALWLIPSETSVLMQDSVLHALKTKPHSSLMQSISSLKEGAIDGLISIGNTGALVAAATLNLPLYPGVRRLGLLARLPTKGHVTSVVDVGATLEPTANDFLQWTLLGAAHMQRLQGIAHPRVGLLNIGVEGYKGTALQQAAHTLLSEHPGIIFVGNVESEDVYQGAVDLLITDGYSGNIFLKTSEAVRDFVYAELVEQLSKNFPHVDLNLLSHPLQSANSAYLLGTPFCIMKCHGALDPRLLPGIVQDVFSRAP